jgi:hypothetical protein
LSLSLRFPHQNPVYIIPFPHTYYHLALLDLIIRTILGDQYRLLSSSLCSFLHSPVTSSLWGPNIFTSTQFSNSHSLFHDVHSNYYTTLKVKVIPQQAEVAQGVPGRLKPRIFMTFGTTRVVSRQPYAPAAFTPGEIPGTHFQRLSRPQGIRFRWSYGKNTQRHHRESIPGPSD